MQAVSKSPLHRFHSSKRSLEDQQKQLTQIFAVMQELGLDPNDLERTGDTGEAEDAAIDADFRSMDGSGESAKNQNLPVLASTANT
jgi:hypothetical protein